jgi:hypothetical protein
VFSYTWFRIHTLPSHQFLAAAARDDDRGDRRGGRDDFLSNRRAFSISVNFEGFPSTDLPNSSGQTCIPSEGRSALAYAASLHGFRWEPGF